MPRIGLSLVLACAIAAQWLAAQVSRDQRLRGDLQYVVAELPRRHPCLFCRIPEPEFLSAARALDAAAPGLRDEEFYVRLSALVASVRDAHTALRVYSGQAAANLGFRSRPITAHENDEWFHHLTQRCLSNQSVLRGLGLGPEAGPSSFSFLLASGEETTARLRRKAKGKRQKANRKRSGLVAAREELRGEQYSGTGAVRGTSAARAGRGRGHSAGHPAPDG